MFKEYTKTINWGGRQLTLETGSIARQADGAVLATYGETQVLATVVAKKAVDPNQDFFPLTVNYQEKFYAAGRIPGGFFKREGRPTEKETLISRLIDRPIRPLFHKYFKNETQIICQVMSHDGENDSDIVAIIAASAALTISGIPFLGPIGGVKVGYENGDFILNPTMDQIKDSELELVVAGTKDGVLMVESEAQELSEKTMLDGVIFGHKALQDVIDMIISLAEECAKDAWVLDEGNPMSDECAKKIYELSHADLAEAYKITKKQDRAERIGEIKENTKDHLKNTYQDVWEAKNLDKLCDGLFKNLESDIVRNNILSHQARIDGRKLDEIRNINCRVGVLKKVHGSSIFTRGETQAIVVSTLGTGQDEQMIDAIEGEWKQAFMLHYNFPPFSVGETGRTGSPGRREIGHGKLAWRAINPLLPSKEEFPYTLRVVSEITESNGSSSMATVCGTSMSLMDAGVPLKSPCAGIAMGLIKEGDSFAVLSDILGDEDHLGDMDFKVAGSKNGITALQMDIKITSITYQIMEVALEQALNGRQHILNEMAVAISNGREQVSNNAPRMVTISVPKDKIRDIIGTGGKVIREITETTGAKMDIDDEGTVVISAVDGDALTSALEWVQSIIAVPEEGKIYQGKVMNIPDFGAFVNFMPNRDGLVHVSEMKDERVQHPSDVVEEGQIVWVKCIGIDDRGKVKLSMRYCDQDTGEERVPAERPKAEHKDKEKRAEGNSRPRKRN